MITVCELSSSKNECLIVEAYSESYAKAVIKKLNESDTTILLVEQNAKVALNLAKHAFVLENGEIVLEGVARNLLDNPKVKVAYLGG